VQRIAIVGSGGAGKTTLANVLGAKLGLPVIHLDEHYWSPGWIATPDDAWRERQRELVTAERWIVDGNYSSTMDLRFERADTVIVVALPRWRCLSRVLRRWITNRGRAVQAPGCPEVVSLEFLKWVWDYPSGGRKRLEGALADHATQANVIELPTPRSVAAFIAAPPS
jgi:adenylate kinase family enzyme